MKWLKVGAVVVGGIVVFFILSSVIHLLLALFGALVFVAIVGGGVYAVAKLVGVQRRRRELGQSSSYHEPRSYDARTTQPWSADEGTTDARTTAPWPAPNTPPGGTPAAHDPIDVENDLARLKREMGK